VKLVVAEAGSEHAAALWDGATVVVSSRLVYPEARAAVAAAHRAGRITPSQLRDAKVAIGLYSDGLAMIDADERLARMAGDLAEQHRLRGYDAVHLASAVSVAGGLPLVATWNHDLAAAAVAMGCTVSPRFDE